MANFYVVWKGRKPGIYGSWTEAQKQIQGFPDAQFKKFPSREEAQAAFSSAAGTHLTRTNQHAKPTASYSSARTTFNPDSLSVDAACSGNPGPMEYQGVRTRDKERVFHMQFPLGTNNIGEFLAIVHGLALLAKQGLRDYPIYSDSATAIKWVRQKQAKTTLSRNAKTEQLFELIDRAEDWLANNPYENPILKWETEYWGEIPADFGRKSG
jgi:ribonuclease HI